MKTMVSTAGGGAQGAVVAIDAPDELQPGAKAGPWIVERELGRGGMGAVYAVVHEEIGKRAALKVVHQRLLAPGFNSDRMLLEAKVVNQVGHPNIVDIFETGKLPDGRPYIVMERLEGQPLSYRADESKILPDQVIGILLQVCDALIAAHAAGVIHRDLKLDNVFLVDNPDDPSTPKVKLLDWGIAKVINHDVRHTVEGQLVGTPQYLSPEQARGAEVSPQTDVYSLGVMAYELFLEHLPFEAETSAEIMAMHLRVSPPPPHEAWPDIPGPLEQLILQMLAKSPDARPTMLQVAHRLEAIRGELERRRAAAFDVAALPAPSTRVPTRASRLASEGVAATALAPEAVMAQRRWGYALGAFALVASATLFLITRSGDSSAATAPASTGYVRTDIQHELDRANAITPPAVLPAPPVAADIAANVDEALPDLDTVLASAATVEPESAKTTKVVKKRASRASAVRSTSMAHRASTRTVPVAPRRATKIDPDGTIDPYQ